MKLHAEIINEEAIEVKLASDLWAELKAGADTFISNTVYFVRKVDGRDQFEVTVEDASNKRSTYAKLNKLALDAAFVPLRPKEAPDAEGYVQYRDINEVQAVKYDGDTVKVDVDGKGVTLVKMSTGDYLVQKSDDDNFTYAVEKAKNFENLYSAK